MFFVTGLLLAVLTFFVAARAGNKYQGQLTKAPTSTKRTVAGLALLSVCLMGYSVLALLWKVMP